jgi:hypothetical protein
MPAESKSQKRTASMAKAIQAGELSPDKFPAAAGMAKSMGPEQLNEFTSTPNAGLPERKKPSKPPGPRMRQVGKPVQRTPIPKK